MIKSAKFTQVSVFVKEIEKMLLDFYQIIVHDLKSWEKPAPKLHPKKEAKAIEKPTEGVKQ